MAKLAAEKKLATQMGTQIHAGDNYRRVVEIVQAGAIGPVREVVVWCGKDWGGGRAQGRRRAAKNLHWDLWLGPAAERPYEPGVIIQQMAALVGLRHRHARRHGLPPHGPAFWALGLRYPPRVEAEGPARRSGTTPTGMTVHWNFRPPTVAGRRP